MDLGRRPGILDERSNGPRLRTDSPLAYGSLVRRTRRRDGARKQRRPVGNPRAREAFRCARGEGAALRRARMRDGAVDVQPLGHVLRAYVADAAAAARGVVDETPPECRTDRAALE